MDQKRKIDFLIKNIALTCSLENVGGYTDMAKGLESLTKSIFSIVDQTTFSTNATKCTNQTIEFSSDSGIDYQVTTNQSFKQKCDDTIKDYKTSVKNLKIIYFKILDSKESRYKKSLMNKYSFLKIIDVYDIVRLICNCATDQISRIVNACQNFCPLRWDDFDDSVCLQIKALCENFVNRKLTWEGHGFINDVDILEIGSTFIIGDASTGKTELLKFLNNESVKKNRYSFLYKLRNYTGQRLEDIIPKAIYYSLQPLLLLDGYDEISVEYLDLFKKELYTFTTKNAGCQIVISSRKNAFDESLFSFDEFNFTNIKDLDDDEINKFFNLKLGSTATKKLALCRTLHVDSLLSNPFYLTRICIAMSSDNEVTNRSQLMEFIFDKDYDKFKFKDSIKKEVLLSQLTTFAEYLIKHNISYVDANAYENLNKKEYKDFPWLSYEDGNITFVHNNFKEYLMALKMATYSFEKIKKLISIRLDKIYIKPQYTNILSFLFDKTKDAKLHKFVFNYGKYLVLDMEPTSLSEDEKFEIVKEVYKEYGEKRSWPDASFFKSYYLSRICNTQEIVEYLISKIDLSNHRTTLIYTLEVLKEVTCWFGNKPKVEQKIYNLLLKDIEDPNIISNLVYFWAQLLPNKDIVCEIYKKYSNHPKSTVRASANYLLKAFNLGNMFVDNIIKSIPNTIPYAHSIGEKIDDITDLGEGMYLEQAIDQIDDEQAILKLLDYLIDNERKYYSHGITEHCFKALGNLSVNSNLIINKVYDLLKLVVHWDSNNIQKFILGWIERNDLKQDIITKIIEDIELQEFAKYNILAKLYDKKYANIFIEAFRKKQLSYPDRLLSEFQALNLDYNGLKIELDKGKIKYIENVKPNYDELRKQNITKIFNSLFDLGIIKEIIHNIYKEINKKKLCRDDVIHYSVTTNIDEKLPFSIMNLFDEKDVEENEITSKLCVNWQIYAIYEILKDNNYLSADDYQREFIIKWVKNELHKFSFVDSMTYDGNRWTTICSAIYCEYFIRKFDIEVSSDIYKQMICFCWDIKTDEDFSQLDFIKNKIGENELKEGIVEYSNNRNLQSFPLSNRIKYCIKNGYNILTKYIVNELSEIKTNATETHQYNTLIDYMAEFNELDLLLSCYNNFPNELKIYTLNKFSQHNNNNIVKLALKNLNTSDELYFNFIKALLLFGNKQVLKLYFKYINENKILYPINNYPVVSLKAYTNKSNLRLLLKILLLTYKYNDEENNVRRDAIFCLEKMCYESKISTSRRIIKRINHFIKFSKFKSTNYLHYYMDNIKINIINQQL